MTRKSKPPTNREMRAVAEHNIKEVSQATCGRFEYWLLLYEAALRGSPHDKEAIGQARNDLVDYFLSVNAQLDYLARIRFVERYPDNDEPVKGE